MAPDDPGLASAALVEFDCLVAALRAAGVSIHVVEDWPEPRCPDAVFPNNWVSFHDDGTVVLYPMLAPTRRHERRPDLLQDLVLRGAYSVTRLLDLTHHELGQRFLEGTGSVVFDHVARVAYACLSPRTHPAVLQELAERARIRDMHIRRERPRWHGGLPHHRAARDRRAIRGDLFRVCGRGSS